MVENTLAVSQKVRNKVVIWPRNSTPRYITTRIKNKESNKYIHIYIFIAALSKAKSWTQSFSGWMDKQIVEPIYNGKLLRHKKRIKVDTYYDMHEP